MSGLADGLAPPAIVAAGALVYAVLWTFLWGGVIASQNTNFRSFYGDDTAWWQMATLFSPTGGGGLLLRSLDENGMFKGIALRKGRQQNRQNIVRR